MGGCPASCLESLGFVSPETGYLTGFCATPPPPPREKQRYYFKLNHYRFLSHPCPFLAPSFTNRPKCDAILAELGKRHEINQEWENRIREERKEEGEGREQRKTQRK
jgi:hypothetical protein